jgi:hypothetical protein
MTIEALVPHVSCICAPSEVDAALAEGYRELYILSTSGIFKHHQFRGENRFIRFKVDSIPGRAKPVEVKEELNFLPAGKVPFELYKQIEAFFREVSRLKSSQLEAMIFILWNPERGYHLFVPTQSVGAASVRFDPTELPSGSIIVIDVH